MKQEIKKKLFELGDPKYKEFHSGLCPGTNNIIGIRVPILRNYAKELVKQHEISYLLTQIDNQYYEEIMLQGMLIGLEKTDFKTLKKHLIKFIPKIDNWAICDVFCASLKITKKYPKEMWEFLQNYLKSKKEFEVRFAVVMILDFYIEESYLKEIFNIFEQLSNREYYIQMAVAWAISICLIKFYEKTITYLKETNLDQFTYNKALQKAIESYRITTRQKEQLRKMKKSRANF